MTTYLDILRRKGVPNAEAILAAAATSGLPVGVAVGLAIKESNGANVYGHDAGGACYGRGEVTKENFLNEFLPAVMAGHTSNGVGPVQITYPGYFTQNPHLAWWDPAVSCLFGFGIMMGYLGGDYSYDSLVAAGSKYNSGYPDRAIQYGRIFAQLANEWTELLAGADEIKDDDVSFNDVIKYPKELGEHEATAGTMLSYLDVRVANVERLVKEMAKVVMEGGIPRSYDNADGSKIESPTDLATTAMWEAHKHIELLEAIKSHSCHCNDKEA